MTERVAALQAALGNREFGVLLHLTSLPEAESLGALGRAADHVLDWLSVAGAGIWQVLPLGPVGDDGSPYFARSTHAGNPRLIDVELLAQDGWLQPQPRGQQPFALWHALEVRRATEALVAADSHARGDFARWIESEKYWLDDYALYCVLAARHGGAPWWDWNEHLRDRESKALREARRVTGHERMLVCAEQFFFHRQWQALRQRAGARGVRLFGDMPIYMAPDAVDVWVHRELFELDERGQPIAVAGVPPDYFSAQGQLWGNPLYRWNVHTRTGFRWWLERLSAELALCDLVRIDHFRAMESFWAVPVGAMASAGHWRPAQGDALLKAARKRFGELPVIAEDLGVITPEVEKLRDDHHLAGMRVMQFGFDGNPANPHLPHNWHANLVAYSGTHDNDTLVGWLAALDPDTHAAVANYLGSEDPAAGFIRALLASVAKLVVLPMQDLIGLGSVARMNTPGTVTGNWTWTLDWADVAPDLASRTRAMAARYGRVRD